MTITAPPKPKSPALVPDPADPEQLEALIEEARRRTRRRRAAVRRSRIARRGRWSRRRPARWDRWAGDSLFGRKRLGRIRSRASIRAISRGRNGPLTFVDGNRIVAIDHRGVRHLLFRCSADSSGPRFCSLIQGIVWSPMGDELLFSSTTVTIPSRYGGMHVLDLRSGKTRRAGTEEFSTAWARDGRIALVDPATWPTPVGWIDIRRIGRATMEPLRSGTDGLDSSPSWSPDGRRLVFSTRQSGESTISLIDSDGSHRQLLARHAFAPAGSPDGRLIAYRSPCGVKLITPSGTAVLPRTRNRCGSLRVHGVPHWSPTERGSRSRGARARTSWIPMGYVADSSGSAATGGGTAHSPAPPRRSPGSRSRSNWGRLLAKHPRSVACRRRRLLPL